ncbi:MAG: hypothetical protein AB8C84_00125 [Oligoflexales bacterium]
MLCLKNLKEKSKKNFSLRFLLRVAIFFLSSPVQGGYHWVLPFCANDHKNQTFLFSENACGLQECRVLTSGDQGLNRAVTNTLGTHNTAHLIANNEKNKEKIHVIKKFNDQKSEEKDFLFAQMKLPTLDLACEKTSDCHAVGIGVSPCGGPIRYEVYSSLRKNEQDAEDFQRKIEQYQILMQKRAVGSFGVCIMVLPPQVSCVASVCQVVH